MKENIPLLRPRLSWLASSAASRAAGEQLSRGRHPNPRDRAAGWQTRGMKAVSSQIGFGCARLVALSSGWRTPGPMIRVQAELFDPAMELAGFARGRTDVGGVASFIGSRAGRAWRRAGCGHDPRALSGHDRAAARGDRGRGSGTLAAARRAGHPSLRTHVAGRADRARGHRQRPPGGGARGMCVPDRLAQDQGAVLEARGVRDRASAG